MKKFARVKITFSRHGVSEIELNKVGYVNYSRNYIGTATQKTREDCFSTILGINLPILW